MTPEIETVTVQCLAEFRADALRAGAKPMKVLVQVLERARMASLTSTSVGEWCSSIQRKLQVHEPSLYSTRAQLALRDLVHDPLPWLQWLNDNHGILAALLRLHIAERKAARQAAQEQDSELP
jgi:hypothetical protein